MLGPLDVAFDVIEILDQIEIDYVLGGSLASSTYVAERSASEAVARHSSFNVIHPSGLKVDLFVIGDGVLDQLQIGRRLRIELPVEPPRAVSTRTVLGPLQHFGSHRGN